MTRRGRKAVLPVGGHRAAPPLAPDGLVVARAYSAQGQSRFDFADLPVAPPMQLSLARLFAARSARWNSYETARSYWVAVTVFARFVASQPEPVGAGGDVERH